MNNYLFLLIFLISLSACNPNKIYESHDSNFPDRRWAKDKEVVLTPEITDTTQKYNVFLVFRHVYGFQFPTLTVNVERTSPSGEVFTQEYVIPVMGGEDKYLSECAGDICDLEYPITANARFSNSGEYKYVITHKMQHDPLPNVMEVGMRIEKVEKQE